MNAQGADFDSLFAVMRATLKQTCNDSDRNLTARRLLRELEDDGLVVHEQGRYRLAEIADRELRDALFSLTS